jgi:peptidyl-prolyl cis-trans isomerase D
MLRVLRKYSNSLGIKILFGLLAGLFVIWGVGAVGGQRVDVMARVNGHAITRRDVERVSLLIQRRYEGVPPELLRSLNLHAQALDELIDEALVRQEAERLGIRVSDGEIDEAITRMPEFQDNGRFARERVEAMLSYQRDRGEFEDQMRRMIILQRLQSLVTDGVQVSDGEIQERYAFDHAQVDLSYVRVLVVDLAKEIVPTDDELAKYLAAHGDRYRIPAKLRARYVAYRAKDFAAQVEVPDKDVSEYYDLHKDDKFTEPEQVRARHILVKVAADAKPEAKAAAKKKAEDLLAKVKAGGDFAALAKKNSDDPGSAAQGGDLGFFRHGAMTPNFEAAAFALAPGSVSDVVETPFGFHVIKVEEKKEAGTKAIDAAHDEIVQTLRAERGLEAARAAAEADRRQIVRGKSLAEAVGGRPVEETPPFSAGGDVPGVGRVKGFSDAAFALASGEVSDLIETDDAVYLLAPFDRVEARVPALDEVRDRVAVDVRLERAQAAAKTKAESILARAKDGGLEKAAGEAGLKVESTGLFDRQTPNIPTLAPMADLQTDAFALTPETPLAPKVYTLGGDALVVSLHERKAADMAGLADAKDGLRDSLLQQKRQAVLRRYMEFLKERAIREGGLEVSADVESPRRS